jgi:excisionase family DNA binding protein
MRKFLSVQKVWLTNAQNETIIDIEVTRMTAVIENRKHWITVAEAAEQMGVEPRVVYSMIYNTFGGIRFYQIRKGAGYRIDPDSISRIWSAPRQGSLMPAPLDDDE